MAMQTKPLRCVVCGGVSARVVWRENGYEGRACHCGTVYTTPPARDAIDPTIDSHPDSYYAAAARRRVRWIKRSSVVPIFPSEASTSPRRRVFGLYSMP